MFTTLIAEVQNLPKGKELDFMRNTLKSMQELAKKLASKNTSEELQKQFFEWSENNEKEFEDQIIERLRVLGSDFDRTGKIQKSDNKKVLKLRKKYALKMNLKMNRVLKLKNIKIVKSQNGNKVFSRGA
jgi:hypothetical protein